MFNTQIGQLDSALAELPEHARCWFQRGAGLPESALRAARRAAWIAPFGGLGPAYPRNLARFLQVAKDNGIFVILTLDELPDTGGYCSSFDTHGGKYAEFNLQFMTQGGIVAQRRYYADFIQGLHMVGAPTDATLPTSSTMKVFFRPTGHPSRPRPARSRRQMGRPVISSDLARRRALMEDSWVHYIGQVSPAIKALDPTALVTMEFSSSKSRTRPSPVTRDWSICIAS